MSDYLDPYRRTMPHVPGANAMPMAVTNVTGIKRTRTRRGVSVPMRPAARAVAPTGGYVSPLDRDKRAGQRAPRKRKTKTTNQSAAALHAAWAKGNLY